ncbi:hypothetical protein RF55_1121 [Lasius niger]|uniref:Uncharacterized protein n=1 Tax=Lasius niger TaxID=67767 RepID=A0A0J7L7B1_LASNI|nr:hypothetical protein RF55_1121 [Lasius niger]
MTWMDTITAGTIVNSITMTIIIIIHAKSSSISTSSSSSNSRISSNNHTMDITISTRPSIISTPSSTRRIICIDFPFR